MRVGTLLLILALAGCFQTPQPNCVFVCGAAGECPDDYACGPDNRCHLMLSGGDLAMCQDQLPVADASVDADPTADASVDADPTADASVDADPTADADPTDADPTDADPTDADLSDAML